MTTAPPFESLGRYRVQSELGAGGMGTVYRAWDPQLARAVAIKVVKFGSSETRARLVREAQSLARLSHPNVCHAYDVGTEGDEVWVAMELIEGATLRTWSTNQTTDALLHALLDAAEGIHAAHLAGLIHRDVKPENVLVTTAGRAVVTDFGLARIDDAVDAVASTVGSGDPHETVGTMTGTVKGTPAYLAPEQLTGAPVDARVDQFAWAVMAWELMTGMRPFPIIHGARLDAIRAGLAPPPKLPRRVGEALVKALSVAPRDRFASMRELIDATGDSATPRRRMPFVVGGAVALLAAAGGFLVVWKLGRAPDGPPPTGLPPALPSTPTLPTPIAMAPDAATAVATSTPDAPPIAMPPDAVIVTPDATTAVATITPDAPPRPKAPIRNSTTPESGENGSGAITSVPPPVTPPPSTAPPRGVKPLSRGVAENLIEAYCSLAPDPTKPDPASKAYVVDWGKVTRAELVTGRMDEHTQPMAMYEVKGQRKTYRFDGAQDLQFLGLLDVEPGTLVALCEGDRGNNNFEVPDAWKGYVLMKSFIPISRPPRVADYAKLAPIHITDTRISKDATNERLSVPAGRRAIARIPLKSATVSGTRWSVSNWFLDVPAGIPGHALMAAKKSRWIVLENPELVPQPDGSKLTVWRAAAIIEDMFPP